MVDGNGSFELVRLSDVLRVFAEYAAHRGMAVDCLPLRKPTVGKNALSLRQRAKDPYGRHTARYFLKLFNGLLSWSKRGRYHASTGHHLCIMAVSGEAARRRRNTSESPAAGRARSIWPPDGKRD